VEAKSRSFSPLFFRRALLSLIVLLFVAQGTMIGRTSQKPIMEYYIYYRGEYAKQAVRDEHAFATKGAAEAARQQRAREIGTHREDVVNGMRVESVGEAAQAKEYLDNTYIKEVPTGRYTTPPPSLKPPSSGGSSVNRPPSAKPTDSIGNDIGSRLKTGTIEGVSFDGDGVDIRGRLKRGTTEAVSPGASEGVIGNRLKTGTAAGGGEVAAAKAALERRDPAAVQQVRAAIAQRQAQPNPWCQSITQSLKIKAPPLPDKMFSQLQPGDVLLVAPTDALSAEAWAGHYLRLFDKLTSWEWQSRAAHTFLYLREVNGVRLFLDSQPGEGPRIKNEDEIIATYGSRHIDVAQPTSRIDADKLWAAARLEGIKQITLDLKKLDDSELARRMNLGTNFGLYGGNNMVCSELSRFALVEAGLEIGTTDSLIKKLLGIYFGPANFYTKGQPFLITPLAQVRKDQHPVK